MAQGRWRHTAAIAATYVQMHVKKGVKVKMQSFNPYEVRRSGGRPLRPESSFFAPPRTAAGKRLLAEQMQGRTD